MKQGQEFLEYAATSALIKALLDLGFFYEARVDRDCKDDGGDEEGNPIIMWFDVAYLTFTYDGVPHSEGFHTDDQFGSAHDLEIYHSRWSDDWYFHIRGERIGNHGFSLDNLNAPDVVANLVRRVKGEWDLK